MPTMDSNSAAKKADNGSNVHQLTIKACDMCRKKKIRCEPTGEMCLQCIKYKTNCHFTPLARKRKRRRPAGCEIVKELEVRLERMEGLLETVVEHGKIGERIGIDQRRLEKDVQILSPSISTNSLEAIQGPNPNPNAKEGLTYQRRFKNQSDSPKWKGSLVSDVFHKLPSKSSALMLIKEAFQGFNSTFPIFNAQSFMLSVHERYSESGPKDPAWWACINVVLAMGHRFRAMRTLETSKENSQAYAYMQNALAVVSELTMLHGSLPAVQALLGMTVVFQGTPNPRLCSVLIATTIRLAQIMGLHRKNRDSSLTEAEIEQRKRVFWIAYFLDKDISLRTRQPPAQDDDDMDVNLPSEHFPDEIMHNNGIGNVSLLNSRLGLANIQGKIYKQLYSVRAAKKSETDRTFAILELDTMLAAWKSNVPIDFEETLTTLQVPIPTESLHKIVLWFTYVNCLVMVHHSLPQNDGEATNFNEVCVHEVRKAVTLIQITPHGDYAYTWLLIHYFFAVVNNLLHNVLYNPSYVFSRYDLQLVEPFLSLLELLAREGKSEEVQQMLELCRDLNIKANDAVQSTTMRMLCDNAAEKGDKESVEDFIKRVECQSNGYEGPEELSRTDRLGSRIDNWMGFGSGAFGGFDILDS